MITETGYGNYAVSNNLIIVAPWINKKWECHDTIGYTGEDFATLDGVQPQFYKNMIERLTSERQNRLFGYQWYNLFS